jgi:hypothetical protein
MAVNEIRPDVPAKDLTPGQRRKLIEAMSRGTQSYEITNGVRRRLPGFVSAATYWARADAERQRERKTLAASRRRKSSQVLLAGGPFVVFQPTAKKRKPAKTMSYAHAKAEAAQLRAEAYRHGCDV